MNTYSLFCSLKLQTETAERHIWNDAYWFYSDWRKVADVEYATNPTTYRFYKGKKAKAFRNKMFKDVMARLAAGDTITVAVDYYGAMGGICRLPTGLLQDYGNRIQRGEVIAFSVYQHDARRARWTEIVP